MTEVTTVQPAPIKSQTLENNGSFTLPWVQYFRQLENAIKSSSTISGYVPSNPPISPETNTKITYDEKGLVTGSDQATTDDIAEASNLYFTNGRVARLIQDGEQLTWTYDPINESLRGDVAIEELLSSIVDWELTTPPTVTADDEGLFYIIPPGATGLWSGFTVGTLVALIGQSDGTTYWGSPIFPTIIVQKGDKFLAANNTGFLNSSLIPSAIYYWDGLTMQLFKEPNNNDQVRLKWSGIFSNQSVLTYSQSDDLWYITQQLYGDSDSVYKTGLTNTQRGGVQQVNRVRVDEKTITINKNNTLEANSFDKVFLLGGM